MFTALARVRALPGERLLPPPIPSAATFRKPAVRAATRNSWLQLLPYQVLLIVWSVDVAALALASVLARIAALGPVPWHGGEVLAVAVLSLCWLSFAGQDVSRAGNGVCLRLRAHHLVRAWPAAFGLLLMGTLAELAARDAVPHLGLPLPWPEGPSEAAWLLCQFVCGLAFLTIGRWAAAAWLTRFGGVKLDRAGQLQLRALVVGTQFDAARVADQVARLESAPIRILGAVNAGGARTDAAPFEPDGDSEAASLRAQEAASHSLCELLRRAGIDTVILAPPHGDASQAGEVMRALQAAPVDIWLAPDLAGCEAERIVPSCGDLPFLRLRDRPLTIAQQAAKKIEDVLVGSVLLLLAAPVMLAIAAAIKLESRGPVLFCQQRRGYGERLITVLKFRTMYAEARDDHAAQQTVRGDARVTRVGRVLRRTSLDELPQLINVLRGEMSVVGPRPHALQTKAEGMLFDDVVENYTARHRVKPGITGWAQVNGWRGETDTVEKIVKRVEFDLHYIATWSLWRDGVIILRTALRMLADREAY